MLTRWEQLQGHEDQRQLFRHSARQGRLSHAYVLAGPAGIGKRQFARLLAMSVFCRDSDLAEMTACGECRACRSVVASTWPDLHEAGLLSGKREILIGQMVGEGEKRGREGLCYELSMTPQASDRRVAIINDAHRLTPEAANALLKTLEEPPASSLILLITESPDQLLPTIRSRCQQIRFFPLSTSVISSILLQQELVDDEETASQVAALCEGSLETAQQLLDADLRQLRDTVARELGRLDGMNSLATAKSVMETIEQISANAAEQRQNAQWLARFTTDAIRVRLQAVASGDLGDQLTQRVGVRRAVDLLNLLLDRTLKATEQVESMVPVSLAVSALFDDLAQLLRAGMRDGSSSGLR